MHQYVMQALGGDTWVQGALSGTKRTGGLTEAQLTDELGTGFLQLPIPRNASATISWWQVRQVAFNRALQVAALPMHHLFFCPLMPRCILWPSPTENTHQQSRDRTAACREKSLSGVSAG